MLMMLLAAGLAWKPSRQMLILVCRDSKLRYGVCRGCSVETVAADARAAASGRDCRVWRDSGVEAAAADCHDAACGGG